MKHIVATQLVDALSQLPDFAAAADGLSIASTVERTRDASHGDFASNIALRLAKPLAKNPREIAAAIIAVLRKNDVTSKIEVAGPGFINFYLSPQAFYAELQTILAQGEQYGRQAQKDRPKILLEFVSANPTGPLHVGHGRLAAYGACVGNLLQAAGYPVAREYYVNDAGRQMDILGASVWLRWLESRDIDVPFPEAGYKGDYIRDIANDIDTSSLTPPILETILEGLPHDAPRGDKEAYIEALIASAKTLQGDAGFDHIRQQALESIRADIEQDLEEFGVEFDRWFSERNLSESGRIDAALQILTERGILYEKDGATWFPSTHFGDEKDRVVVRENGVKTYFASDIAYHFDKRERGFDYLIDILGADHHGYIARVRAGLDAMGYSADDLEVELVQFVSLYRKGQKMQMSTRSGEFDTLRQLRAEVGNDAARFYYVMRSNDQHLDFDLDDATSKSNDNPVFYIQYAHARIASVFRQLRDKSVQWNKDAGIASLSDLVEPQETSLLSTLSRYPEVLELAADNRAPQHLVHYLRELANDFHTYYNAHAFIVDNAPLRNARLTLIAATKIAVANGLAILGVSAPEKM
jgi:arginyl-tRNA synthetase